MRRTCSRSGSSTESALAGFELKADNPAQFHRGWPGVGFTHSLAFGVFVGLLLYIVTRNKVVAYSFVIGQWAHALTDIGDTVGTMLLFPFTTHLFSVGAWAYAGQTGRYTDAGAYYSGLGFVWDGVFVVWGILSWRVLTRGYFRTTVMAADPFWQWAGRYLSETTLVALYRGLLLLRRLPVGGVAHLGSRRAVVPHRPALGRSALGSTRLRGRAELRAGLPVSRLLLDEAQAWFLRRRGPLRLRKGTLELDQGGATQRAGSSTAAQADAESRVRRSFDRV